MKNLAILVGTTVITLAATARANPIMTVNEVSAQQVPGTTYVQLTHLDSMSEASMDQVTRDGQAIQVTAAQAMAGPSRDLGSGMTTIHAKVGCDCSVGVGHHRYVVDGKAVELDVVAANAASSPILEPSAGCDTKCPSAEPFVPVGGSGGVGSAGAPSSDAGAAGTSTAGAGTDDDDDDESSGCSMARGAGAAVPLGFLAGLALLALRRRQ